MDKTETFERLKELDLSSDEINKIGEALKKDEFRTLLIDYINEIKNPENKKLYEKELIELEKERGNDITFLHPKPCYVIKTIINGKKKCFINICENDLIDKPTSKIVIKNNVKGLEWQLPHSLSPPIQDFDKKNQKCDVYDVLFHPDTIHLTTKNKSFKTMLNNTALNAIETNFNVNLDKINLKYPKITYKGNEHSSVIRKPLTDHKKPERTKEEQEFYEKLFNKAEENIKPIKKTKQKPIAIDKNYTTPNYLIKQRKKIEMDEFTQHNKAKLNITIPNELIIDIELPLLKSSKDLTLDVTENQLKLQSDTPAKYKLNLTLPYHVNHDIGNAKFDKDLRKLIITLPVLRNFEITDSGVDSDSPINQEFEDEIVTKSVEDEVKPFLNPNHHYNLPEFTCHILNDIIAFTLNVKNVNNDSISKLIVNNTIHVKFTSISPSYYCSYYSFFVKLQVDLINLTTVEVWDNNVIVQIQFTSKNDLISYKFGIDNINLKENFIEEPHILNKIHEELPKQDDIDVILSDDDEKIEIQESNDEIKNFATSYESSGDELSLSYSPGLNGGILKKSRTFSRSISESSLDDFGSLDVQELSTSLKKTVRFNDVVSKQLYRFNSSILGQKRKNRRKALKKKKALERRHSESEASEIDDKKIDFSKEIKENLDEDNLNGDENIFDLDI